MRVSFIPRAKAGIYLGKAEEFLRAAEAAAERKEWNAVGLGSVHAGISAVDAITTFYLGERSRDPDHQVAAQLLRRVPLPEAAPHAEQFALVVREKNRIEYEAALFRAKEAQATMLRAKRLVSWARVVVSWNPPTGGHG